MKTMFALSMVLISCWAGAQTAKPLPQPQTLQQKLDKTEKAMVRMAADHGKLMARLKQIEDQIDGLTRAIHDIRLKIEKK